MRCPTPCALCGEITELSDLAFNTAYCPCAFRGDCEHGLCVECAAAVEQEQFDDWEADLEAN